MHQPGRPHLPPPYPSQVDLNARSNYSLVMDKPARLSGSQIRRWRCNESEARCPAAAHPTPTWSSGRSYDSMRFQSSGVGGRFSRILSVVPARVTDPTHEDAHRGPDDAEVQLLFFPTRLAARRRPTSG